MATSAPGARRPMSTVSRRRWLRIAGVSLGAGALALRDSLAEDAAPAARPSAEGATARGIFFPREASWYEKADDLRVKCRLCPRGCEVENGDRGFCGTRENREGVYHTLVWGNPCALHDDPVEKKPFFHFRPGTRILSLATAGCNMACRFCQNWAISQVRPEETENLRLPPEELVALARRTRCPSIAFTYSEPTVFSEYVRDTAILARESGIDTVTVSNGYIERKPMQDLCKVLAAVKIDLKAFTDRFYRELCGAEGLAPVLRTIETVAASGVWLEVVNLVIPTWNDSEAEARAMARWLVKSVGKDVPLHFTRFHPTYKLRDLPVTPVKTLERMREAALAEGLRFVYIGNVPGHEGENTRCPSCGKVVIRRLGQSVVECDLEVRDGRASCGSCGAAIAGRF